MKTRASEFRWNEWNHEYLSIVLIPLGIWLDNWWIIGAGILVLVDGITQLIWCGQHGGLLHVIYINTLYKWKWVQDFNRWMDKIFSGYIHWQDIGYIILFGVGVYVAYALYLFVTLKWM